jgi:hypothetical protein
MTSSASVSQIVTGSTQRIRDYFPETVFWEPERLTDSAGAGKRQIQVGGQHHDVEGRGVRVDAGQADSGNRDRFTGVPAVHPRLQPAAGVDGRRRTGFACDHSQLYGTGATGPVSLHRNSWSDVLGAAERQMTIGAGSSENAVFSVRAKAAPDKVSQRLIATSGREGDSIEKSLRVHPDGRELIPK